MQQITITREDAEKLRELILKAQQSNYRGSPYLQQLGSELNRAKFVDPGAIPPDVITMNSTVRLRDEVSGDESIYTLVFPEDADMIAGKISVLAPVGTAMLGYRSGDVFEWDTPEGVRRLRVVSVLYQPEASKESGQ